LAILIQRRFSRIRSHKCNAVLGHYELGLLQHISYSIVLLHKIAV
jgi:hypothetical protein